MDRLSTPRLILRPLTARDVPLLLDFDLRNQAHLAPWEPLRDQWYFTEVRAASSIKADRKAARNGLGMRWHVFVKGRPGKILGSVSLTNITGGVFLSCHLGYRLDGGSTGQGYMTEAVGAVVNYAFGPLGLHRVEANVMPRNRASRRLLARLGFAEEGLAKGYLKIAGVWEDHLHHVLLNPTME